MGNTCQAGACTPCAGCINISTGACETGSSNGSCGKNGGFCQACDQQAGQTCQSGTCFGGTTCNATTCQGCCDGNNCKLPAQYTTAQCGQGAPGAACIGCVGQQVCDAVDAGACIGNAGTGGGGGGIFPGLDGGLFPGTCDPMSGVNCANGECCAEGFCVPNGTSLIGQACGVNGGTCAFCIKVFGVGTTCNVTAGVCQ
ncbi:MAG: hypothetical protein DI536_13660 [Archangium gephyra]|uniref:Uncharacterized protein n=1 Tax=Archangium gephyra TaxID=48 RepID=A0A2W5THP1_9BACT|nr:MAG: hypothetical protein DI536_13660 [Archangium gephyra]